MAKLNVDQKSIFQLLSNDDASFLIPDYQRPYTWDEDLCQTLWDDLFAFSFPDNNCQSFNRDDEYYLGSIVTFKNSDKQLEVIDGQQRLTTILLFLRAFYDKFEKMKDPESELKRKEIELCIWKTTEIGFTDKLNLKIDSEVATDNDKSEFLEILRTGKVQPIYKSQYFRNYACFQKKVEEFQENFASYFPYFPTRVLKNCIMLPIEADSQDTALRIFSTLNDRGLPLADADIFKAQLYKFRNEDKDKFVLKWKELEKIASSTLYLDGAPMDELFTRYMYYLRAKEGIKDTTTESLRKFYERRKYHHLKNVHTLPELEELALFWRDVANDVSSKVTERFSDPILRKFFVLTYAPNRVWQNIVSVYFLKNRTEEGLLSEPKFEKFLDKITAFIFAYTVTNPGVNALRTPVYDEMVNIVNGREVTFSKYKFNIRHTRQSFENFNFTNQRNITRSMITWYAYTFDKQDLLDLKDTFNLEHIYPKNRREELYDSSVVELLGNKVLLEKSINIRASDYRFKDKKNFYKGELPKGKDSKPTKVREVLEKLCSYEQFGEEEIKMRNKRVIDRFFDFLKEQELIDSE